MNVSSSTTGIEKDLWRLTAPEFETWESRGEITATRNVKQYHLRTIQCPLYYSASHFVAYTYKLFYRY